MSVSSSPPRNSAAFAMAPATVVRIAAWPLESLTALAAPDLAARAEAGGAAFEADYQRVLQDQRRHLWDITARDGAFRAALALSSPSLAQRLGDGVMPQGRNKRARHLDKSLYRYLARGVSRIEPYGLWTGVTVAPFAAREETTVGSRSPRVHPAPELAPLRDLLAALGQGSPYRERGPWHLNPTLQRDEQGQWCHARHTGRGVIWRRLPDSQAWAILVAELPGPPATLEALADRLARRLPREAARSLLDLALKEGLLLGGLSLPARYESPWEALAGVEPLLTPDHRRAWNRARRRSETICRWLARHLEAVMTDPVSIPALEAAARVIRTQQVMMRVLAALARVLALPAPRVDAPLRCDLAAPFAIALGRRDRQRLSELLAQRAERDREQTVGRVYRQRVTALLARGDLRHSPFTAPVVTPLAAAPPAPDPDRDTLGPPLGALVVRFGSRGLERPWVRGLSDVATATHARHAWHLRTLNDPLTAWFRRSLARVAREGGLTLADLAQGHPGSPNLLARPAYVPDLVDPWGCDPEALPLDRARLVSGPGGGALLLELDGRRLATQAMTAVTCGEDPVLERLMATGFNWSRAEAKDAASPGCAERRTLADGTLVEPRRTRLSEPEVAALTTARGAERYRLWQRLTRRYRWPLLVRVTCDHAPALLIPTDSPLALEVAFEGVGSRGGRTVVLVEELGEGAWLQGRRGRHLAELVLPVRRRRHLWQDGSQQLKHSGGAGEVPRKQTRPNLAATP